MMSLAIHQWIRYLPRVLRKSGQIRDTSGEEDVIPHAADFIHSFFGDKTSHTKPKECRIYVEFLIAC